MGIINRIHSGVHANMPLADQPLGGMVELIHQKDEKLDNLRLIKLTFARKLVACTTTLNAYKKFVTALGDTKVDRVDALIRAGLNRGEGIYGMIERLDRANQGLYKPKSFTEEERLRGVLFLRLGGSRVAELAH